MHGGVTPAGESPPESPRPESGPDQERVVAMHKPFSVPSISQGQGSELGSELGSNQAGASAPTPQGIAFTGERGEFRKLVMRGAGLELITLGFYRFWLATDIRRHLWSHTEVHGDAAEYTGSAKELLLGFLVAMAILVPVYVAYFFAGLEAERLQAFASIPLIAFLYLFTQFALYRARRYRMTRTIWRGVRFNMGGSGWAYAWRAALWTLWVWTTLGLALPWRAAALERFKMRYTSYGTLQGSFEGNAGQFFKQAWWLWLLMWPSAFLIFPLPFFYAMYKAIEWRWWVNGLRFGAVRFENDLDIADLMGLYWKVIGWLCLAFLLMAMWFAAVFGFGHATVGSGLEGETKIAAVMSHPAILIGMGVGYVAAALALNVIIRIYLVRDLWAKVAETSVVHNIAAADNVAVMGDAANAIGEGFADSLDIGGF
ncbi:MAG TPA: DUF898 family protein [Erythrobacter sp.]|nr:DUF898 family protein [Erythrobacter sp.]